MTLVYLALGVIFLVGAIGDVLWTTLWIEGGTGSLTSRLMAWTWRALRRIGAGNSRLLSLSGPLLFVLTLVIRIPPPRGPRGRSARGVPECPLPPTENWLEVSIEAGEKAYH